MTLSKQQLRQTVLGSAVGNVLEWYDFAAYAYMAPIIGKIFFPSDDVFASTIASFGAFAAGYVSRPVGAIIFGHIGDKIGRKDMLLISVLVMGLCTTAIGILPDSTSIGWGGAALLVSLRVLQGLSVGGEYGGALIFMAEHAPVRRRGFLTSIINAGSSVGFLFGAGIAAILTEAFDQQQLEDWAWRVPFLFGGAIAMTAMLLRRSLREPPTPDDFEPLEELPFVVALRGHWRDILRVGGLYVTVNSGFYLIFVYAVSYLTEIVHVPSEAVLDINIVCVFLLVILPPSFALIGDRIGRKPVLISGTIGILVLSYPLFALMNHDNTTLVLLAQIGFAVLFSWIYCANPATMVEVAPYAVRASVLTISINLAMAVFGGTMPLVASYLVERTADDFSPVYYLMGLAMFTLIAVLTCRETYRKELT